LLLYGDFSGRVNGGDLENGIMDASLHYYVEQSKNWLFYATFLGTKGWRLDLDNQILLGGDNGLRGYPLRYQDGTERAQATVEQRYFTDWYPFRLVRVGGAVFFDAGRVWGNAPLAAPNLGHSRMLDSASVSATHVRVSAMSCTSTWRSRSRRPPISARSSFWCRRNSTSEELPADAPYSDTRRAWRVLCASRMLLGCAKGC
jgi:Omp85 superfamily domain